MLVETIKLSNGTVYVENVGSRNIYRQDDHITSRLADKGIGLSKIDFYDQFGKPGALTLQGNAVIAEIKPSSLHPDLVLMAISYFTHNRARDRQIPSWCRSEIEYHDSRYVIKDWVIAKFYKGTYW